MVKQSSSQATRNQLHPKSDGAASVIDDEDEEVKNRKFAFDIKELLLNFNNINSFLDHLKLLKKRMKHKLNFQKIYNFI